MNENIVNQFFNTFFDYIDELLGSVLFFLPSSPFINVLPLMDSNFSVWFAWLNWLFPIATFVSIAEVWLSAIGIYYIGSVALRWVKAIE
ncbi:MAG: hypothetical protein RR540_02590 [Oscillospiraceae bacterium]